MTLPNYSSKEIMERNVLTAIRLCGDINLDGEPDGYGSEHDDDNEENEDYNANENGDADSDGDSVPSLHMSDKYFPIYKAMKKKETDEDGDKKEAQEWALQFLAEDDEANKPDLTLDEYDFNAGGFRI